MFSTLLPLRRGWQPAVLLGLLALAAPLGAAAQTSAPKAAWTNTADLPAAARRYTAQLTAYRAIDVNMAAMRAALLPAPAEQLARTSAVVLALPTPEGGTARFRMAQVTVMHPVLAAKYPSIKTYQGWGLDDPTALVRLDVSPSGFHAMVMSSQDRYYIDPAQWSGDDVHHLVFRRAAMKKQPFVCGQDPLSVATPTTPVTAFPALAQRQANGTQLKTYRLALANTYEYAAAVGNTLATVAAAKVTAMNRVNGVYEREFSARMVLVANNNLLDFVRNGPNVPNPVYDDTNTMNVALGQNQTNVSNVIGSANYDIGHLFTTGGGGVAQRPSLCVAGVKARGLTGLPNPVGDAFYIDFVAHEMGHQFNGSHTFNSSSSNCGGGNRAANVAYEPGSGVTIMAYAGICAPEDLDQHSIDVFHTASFDEILSHLNGQGNCGVITSTNNAPPVPNASGSYTIPRSTPFALTGSATDADNDPLTYSWEEYDREPNNTAIGAPTGNQPIFRSFLPSTSPTRYFPRLVDLQNTTTTFGEMLPTYNRVMNFRLTARDNRGGVNYAATQVTVDATTGPLLVTLPNTSNIVWQAGAPASVAWDVAGTTAAPVSAANVDLLLSTDGGNTYPIVLLSNTPNDGSQAITVPAGTPATNTARVMVRASGNIFFDISDHNFTVEASNGPTFFLTPAASSTGATVCNGASGAAAVSVGQLQGFAGSVTLGTANLPTGFSVSFAPASAAAGATATATVSAAASVAPGPYSLLLTGTSNGVTHSTYLPVTVLTSVSQAAVGVAPAAAATAIQRPHFSWGAVPNATSYHIQVAANNTFAPVLLDQTVSGPAYIPAVPLVANTPYYWRVQGVNICTSGPYSAPLAFQTGTQFCSTTAATGNQAIAAGSVLTSVLNIPSGGRVGEVRVRNLVITGPAVDQLQLTLTNPAGTAVVVLARNTCPTGNGLNLNLDDLAPAAIACPANTGATARPSNPLAALADAPANGNWTLRVDNAGTGTGTLVSWGLEVCTLGQAAEAPTSVVALYNGYANGVGNNEVIWTPATTGSPATFYELQRSVTTNNNFATISGNIPLSSGGIYEDYLTASGLYFYRVRSCNAFGCSAWTNEASVLGSRATAQALGVSVAPNPSAGVFEVVVGNDKTGPVALRVTDALGRTVAQAQLLKTSSTLTHALDLSRCAPGIYNLHLTLPTGTVVQKLVKE